MHILVIDGHGGKMGSQLVRAIIERYPEADLTAIGTNSVATAAMKKSGAPNAATGQNAVRVACRNANVILGPIGIVIADALLGEVTPDMAVWVAQANAVRILLPINRCENQIAGLDNPPMSALIEDAIFKLSSIMDK